MIKLVPPLHETYPITQGFGGNAEAYARFGLKGHNGIDWGCPQGTVVHAAASGIIYSADYDPDGYGNYMIIQHDDKSMTLYAHLSFMVAHTGYKVNAGDMIGRSGFTGNVYPPGEGGAHLHFEYRLPGQKDNGYGGAVDPLPYLDGSVSAETAHTGLSGNTELTVGDIVTITEDGNGLRLRVRPDTTGKIYGYASTGDQFVVREIVQEGDRTWAKVEAYLCLVDGGNVYAVKT